MHVTRDGGKNWERITPPDLPEFARISLIEASPHQNGVAYLAANRYQLGDRQPYIYKTADFGKTWTKIVNGIPGDDFPRAIREDRKRRGLLYVGTERGIYVSFNDGGNWQPLQLNLPVTPVHGIVSEERDLVIGTHGRGFYVLDDINVLRQATADITTAALHVFEPTNPIRGFDNNVAFDYFLAQGRRGSEDRDPRPAGRRCCDPSPGRRRTRSSRRDRGRAGRFGRLHSAASRRAERDEPVHVGSAAGGRRRLPGHDHVGRPAAAWAGVTAGARTRCGSTANGETKTRAVHHRPRSPARRRRHHRSVSAGAVQALVARARRR